MPLHYVADLHCHPQARAFNYFRNNPRQLSNVCNDFPKEWSPWVLPPADGKEQKWKGQLAGKRPGCFAQADFNRLASGSVRMVFASLYPLESGFVRGKQPKPFWKLIQAVLKPISLMAENNGVRSLAQCLQMKYPVERIRFFQGNRKAEGRYMDYWEEVMLEYYFLAARDGVEQMHVFRYYAKELQEGVSAEQTIRLQHSYCLAQSRAQLSKLLASDTLERTIAVVLTIEGSHMLSMDGSNRPLEWSVVEQRLRRLKHWGRYRCSQASAEELKDAASLKKWAAQKSGNYMSNPIFLINLSHHFNNYLAAHARSLPDKLRLIMDQSAGMCTAKPVTDMGRKVIEACLNIKRREEGHNIYVEDEICGNRILIDVKHMSPASRKVYYRDYILPYNASHPLIPIPVVATHVGVTGDTCRSLEDLHQQELTYLMKDLVKSDICSEGFLLWGINMCEEDIAVISASKGILALSMDQRILGKSHGTCGAADLIRNLLYIIHLGKRNGYRSETEGDSIWNCVSIGSDFDGFIDPLNTCPSVMHYENLHKEMEELLTNAEDRLFEPYGLTECLNKLFWQNAVDFVQQHFPEPVGEVSDALKEMV